VQHSSCITQVTPRGYLGDNRSPPTLAPCSTKTGHVSAFLFMLRFISRSQKHQHRNLLTSARAREREGERERQRGRERNRDGERRTEHSPSDPRRTQECRFSVLSLRVRMSTTGRSPSSSLQSSVYNKRCAATRSSTW